MDLFAQNKRLLRLVLLLVGLNVLTIGFWSWQHFTRHPKRPGAPDHGDVALVLQRELHLSEGQVRQVRALRTGFFENEQRISTAIRAERDSMNTAMFNKNIDSLLVQQLARRIAEHEYEMELLRLQQAQAFRAICTPEQLERFEGLVREIRDYFKPEGPVR